MSIAGQDKQATKHVALSQSPAQNTALTCARAASFSKEVLNINKERENSSKI
jgi:hypothetical protein